MTQRQQHHSHSLEVTEHLQPSLIEHILGSASILDTMQVTSPRQAMIAANFKRTAMLREHLAPVLAAKREAKAKYEKAVAKMVEREAYWNATPAQRARIEVNVRALAGIPVCECGQIGGGCRIAGYIAKA